MNIERLYYKDFRDKLRRFLWKNYKSNKYMQDIIQDAAVRAFRFKDSFKGDCSEETWLFRICINCALTYWTHDKRKFGCEKKGLEIHEEDDVLLSDTNPYDELEADRRAQKINRVVNDLREDHLEFITARYSEGLTYEELAEKYDMPLGSVKSRVHYMKKKLELL